MSTNVGFYLSNGAVDVAAAIALATLLVQKTKSFVIESWMPPARGLIHDDLVQVYVLAWSAVLVLLGWAAGPGFHTASDAFTALVATVVAWASSNQLYATVRGPQARTPLPAPPAPAPVAVGSTLLAHVQQRISSVEQRIAAMEAAARGAHVDPVTPAPPPVDAAGVPYTPPQVVRQDPPGARGS